MLVFMGRSVLPARAMPIAFGEPGASSVTLGSCTNSPFEGRASIANTFVDMLNELEVTGRARSHIVQIPSPHFAAQQDVAVAFLEMRRAAVVDGIDLLPVSSFRDYRTQLRIWNRKFNGAKPLYDMDGLLRERGAWSDRQTIEFILNWSALPGGSRHQWGTDIDVVDGNAMAAGYLPQLLPQEVRPGGIFVGLHQWLDDNMARFGFFRPYNFFRGGMYPEPWHLSFAPASLEAIKHITPELLLGVTRGARMLGRETALEMIPEIHEKHVLNYVGPDEQTPVVLPPTI